MIQNCAPVLKKLRSYNEQSTSTCSYLMCCEELRVRRDSLKMTPENTKTCQSSN